MIFDSFSLLSSSLRYWTEPIAGRLKSNEKAEGYISYEIRLRECSLTTQETRLLMGEDQIEVLKILNGYENIDRNIIFLG